ncbi:Xanthine dehydrogenase 1 [Sesamum alatum]|uniref:indole-3-acetaldehyde oxidase n=1 Tax=Sesamum alatum TaxID=300844 RepID=A0AAE1XX64_9LAMI|nr:Xanthine dehydrogenase 1 [Sesamum alatum]
MGSLMTESEMDRVEESGAKEPILYVNGVRRVLPDGLAHLTLLEYLRDIGLTGTKLGCGEGGCGACTVMISYFDQNSKKCVHLAINACLAPLYSVEGMHVITVEGVGNRRYGLHPIQESLALSHGSQCGFCTPGFIMSMYALLRSSDKLPSKEDIEENLAGNLCRCTGYRPIVDAFRVFARTNDALYTNESSGLSSSEFVCPSTGQIPDAKLVVGNTEVGIETRLKSFHYPVLIHVAHVPELNQLIIKDEGLEIGAAVKLSELVKVLKVVLDQRSSFQTSSCRSILEQLKWFAGTQIRNVASVGGNICTASPISDLNPLWMAAGARFKISDCRGITRACPAENFFLGYRKVDLASNEILLSVFLPWNSKNEFVKEFKQAHRRDDDIAIVNAGMRVCLEEKDQKWVVSDASIVYGGVAPYSVSANETKKFLIGKHWNKEMLQGALKVLEKDIVLKEDAPGGMVEFRKSLILSFFFKFFLWVCHQMDGVASFDETVPASHLSAIKSFQHPSVIGSQDYEIVKHGSAVGAPEVHLSSRLQVTGEAEYTDDVPMPPNSLHAALILSKKPHARILEIDDVAAKSSPGFAGIFFAKDVPGTNKIGPIVADEELFASGIVTCVGQVIGVVVADTHENAKHAARKVHIQYEELPAVLSIEDAIESNSFHPNTEKCMREGDVEHCFLSGQCDKIVEGEVRVGGQEHFYLEPNSTLIWTTDGGNEVHMISSTQAPQKHQKYVANVLGLPMSKVVCKTKRIGGGFGGKETRSAFVAAAAAIPSYLLNRPVKITLDRDIDMIVTGQRHSFLGKYKVGFTKDGKILALDLEIFNNAGNSLDLSLAVLERAMFHSDNVYEIPNVRIKGKRISMEVQKSPEEIREINFQREGSVLHYGQQIEHCTLERLWNGLKASCDFLSARKEVEQFNLQNRWKKRGVAIVPTKFGISFTAKFMNQAGALVQVYTDGTVLVTHGGVEMGQGLHTKVAQVAASSFNIPLSSVFISETSTDKVPNASPTAASASSDLYGAAVLDACEQIKARMEPMASKHNFGSFAELAYACYMERIDLSAHGFYKTPDIGFDWATGKGVPFRYFTYGAAFAEVEIDTLMGDFHTRRADVILDLGFSLNPAIDVGQIEGAFVQGLGWVALEELKWGDAAHKWLPPGCLYTCGPGTYKIPSINDVPFKFSVSLLKNAGKWNIFSMNNVSFDRMLQMIRPSTHRSSGEPPFFLASAVFFAIKDAIIAARAEEGLTGWFPLDNPATPERIRMACIDDFTKPFVDDSHFRPKLSV